MVIFDLFEGFFKVQGVFNLLRVVAGKFSAHFAVRRSGEQVIFRKFCKKL